METLAQAISRTSRALENCKAKGNAVWADKWESYLGTLMSQMPSGGGFDAGTQLVTASDTSLTFATSFHHMDKHGGYDGWTEHKVQCRATFLSFDIIVTGKDRNGIKDYIAECFAAALSQEALPFKG